MNLQISWSAAPLAFVCVANFAYGQKFAACSSGSPTFAPLFSSYSHLAVPIGSDGGGNIYVKARTAVGVNFLQRFSPIGVLVYSVPLPLSPTPAPFDYECRVFSNGHVWAASTSSGPAKLLLINGVTGLQIGDYSSLRSSSSVLAMELDPAGGLWFADGSTLTHINHLGFVVGTLPVTLGYGGIAVLPDGNVIVKPQTAPGHQEFANNGTFVTSYGATDTYRPAIAPGGTSVWLKPSGSLQFHRFSRNGLIIPGTAVPSNSGYGPVTPVVLANGNVLCVNAGTIREYTDTGLPVATIPPSPGGWDGIMPINSPTMDYLAYRRFYQHQHAQLAYTGGCASATAQVAWNGLRYDPPFNSVELEALSSGSGGLFPALFAVGLGYSVPPIPLPGGAGCGVSVSAPILGFAISTSSGSCRWRLDLPPSPSLSWQWIWFQAAIPASNPLGFGTTDVCRVILGEF